MTIKFAMLASSFAAAGALAACADESPRGRPAEAEPSAPVAQAVSAFEFDTSALEVSPLPSLPVRPLTLGAFALPNVQRALLGVTETFTGSSTAGTRSFLDSPTWHLEIDAAGGQILAVSQAPSRAITPPGDRVLETNARERLASFGVPSEELGPVFQRRSMSLDEQDGATATAAEIEGYKTFAIRGINGVRVHGHRAVLTYGPDGVFRRALVKWPALASTGHKLRTSLATGEIMTRATRALIAEGIGGGPVKLRWLYVPTALTTGEVTLELEVIAIIPGSTELGEGRAVEVVVDAT